MVLADYSVPPPGLEVLLGLAVAGIGGFYVWLIGTGRMDKMLDAIAQRLQNLQNVTPRVLISFRTYFRVMALILTFVGGGMVLSGLVRLLTKS